MIEPGLTTILPSGVGGSAGQTSSVAIPWKQEVRVTRISVENINHPGSLRRVDAMMYEAMREAYLSVVPERRPGLTIAEIHTRLLGAVSPDLFPDPVRTGWWAKTVQLDLEAKGVIARTGERPLRLYKV